MAAQSVDSLPEGDEWLYELKLDGYRALVIKNGPKIQIRSRNDKDLTKSYPSVEKAALQLNAKQAIVDGEIVAIDEKGRHSFQALQHRGTHPGHVIAFYAFDLLHLDGDDLIDEPLVQRRAKLPSVLDDSGLLLSVELPGSASEVVQAVRAMGLEGVVAKRRNSSYQPGERGDDWQKLKLDKQQEFVIGGYRPAGTDAVDALIVGYYEGKRLRFAGKVKNGFVPHTRRELGKRLAGLRVSECPFSDLPSTGSTRWHGGIAMDEMGEMRWTRPQLVAQIRFTDWPADGLLRHSAFLGLRDDKAPREIVREIG